MCQKNEADKKMNRSKRREEDECYEKRDVKRRIIGASSVAVHVWPSSVEFIGTANKIRKYHTFKIPFAKRVDITGHKRNLLNRIYDYDYEYGY